MNRPVRATLPGGRLHLQHGPIDLVIEAWGERHEIAAAYEQAWRRFQDILETLVAELPILRRAVGPAYPLARGPVARRMVAAVWPHRDVFITPMAAVAGSVADEMLADIVVVLVGHGDRSHGAAKVQPVPLIPANGRRKVLLRILDHAASCEGLFRVGGRQRRRPRCHEGQQGRRESETLPGPLRDRPFGTNMRLQGGHSCCEPTRRASKTIRAARISASVTSRSASLL